MGATTSKLNLSYIQPMTPVTARRTASAGWVDPRSPSCPRSPVAAGFMDPRSPGPARTPVSYNSLPDPRSPGMRRTPLVPKAHSRQARPAQTQDPRSPLVSRTPLCVRLPFTQATRQEDPRSPSVLNRTPFATTGAQKSTVRSLKPKVLFPEDTHAELEAELGTPLLSSVHQFIPAASCQTPVQPQETPKLMETPAQDTLSIKSTLKKETPGNKFMRRMLNGQATPLTPLQQRVFQKMIGAYTPIPASPFPSIHKSVRALPEEEEEEEDSFLFTESPSRLFNATSAA